MSAAGLIFAYHVNRRDQVQTLNNTGRLRHRFGEIEAVVGDLVVAVSNLAVRVGVLEETVTELVEQAECHEAGISNLTRMVRQQGITQAKLLDDVDTIRVSLHTSLEIQRAQSAWTFAVYRTVQLNFHHRRATWPRKSGQMLPNSKTQVSEPDLLRRRPPFTPPKANKGDQNEGRCFNEDLTISSCALSTIGELVGLKARDVVLYGHL